MAKLYESQSNERKEIRIYERLLDLEPRNTKIQIRLARLYSVTGDIQKQIACYEKVLAADSSNQQVLEELILAYADGLRSQQAFNLSRAQEYSRRYHEQFHSNSADAEYFREISDELRLTSNPEANFALNSHNHDFSGDTNNQELFANVAFVGPVTSSRLTVMQSFLVTNAQNERPILRDLQPFKLTTARLYRTQLSWQHDFRKLRLNITPGLMGLMSASPSTLDYGPNLITTVNFDYQLHKRISLSSSYDLNYITLTTRAIEQEIHRHRFHFSLLITPWNDLQWQTEVQYLRFSDNNRGKMFMSGFDYTVFKTSPKVKDVEAYLPLEFDETGTQITAGARYEYLTNDEERETYPTAIDEHVVGFTASFTHQVYRSFFVNLEGFFGVDNKKQNIWGYHLGFEKQLNWRLNLVFEYEDFRSPYVFDGQNFVNRESNIYFGVRSRF